MKVIIEITKKKISPELLNIIFPMGVIKATPWGVRQGTTPIKFELRPRPYQGKWEITTLWNRHSATTHLISLETQEQIINLIK